MADQFTKTTPEGGFLPESTFAGTPSQDFANAVTQDFGESPVSPDEPGGKDRKGKFGRFLEEFDTAGFGTNVADIFSKIFLDKDLGTNAALEAKRAGEAQLAFQQQTLEAQRQESAAGREAQAGLQEGRIEAGAVEGAAERDLKRELEDVKATNELAAINARGKVESGIQAARNAGLRGNRVLDAALANGVDTTSLIGLDLDTAEGAATGAARMAEGIRRNLNKELDAETRKTTQQRDAAIGQTFKSQISGFNMVTDPSGVVVRVPTGLGSAYDQSLALLRPVFAQLRADDPTIEKSISDRRRQYLERTSEEDEVANAPLAQEFDPLRVRTHLAEQRQARADEWDRALKDINIAIASGIDPTFSESGGFSFIDDFDAEGRSIRGPNLDIKGKVKRALGINSGRR